MAKFGLNAIRENDKFEFYNGKDGWWTHVTSFWQLR